MEQKVMITGAARGIGLSLTDRFLRSGFQVLAGARSVSPALAKLLREFPESSVAVTIDVTDVASIHSAVSQVGAKTKALDMLINNAAVNLSGLNPLLDQLDLADSHLEKTFAANVFGPLRVTQAFLPLLKQGRLKVLANITSEAGSIADCGRDREYAYCMSKAALNMETKILHNYLAPLGYRVLAIHPGWVRTDMGGPNARLSPEQSAEGIYKLLTQNGTADEPLYIDYAGKALRW